MKRPIAREGNDGRPAAFARVDRDAAVASRQQHRDVDGIRRGRTAPCPSAALGLRRGWRARQSRARVRAADPPAASASAPTGTSRRGSNLNHPHVAGCQRPGLVRADHRRGAERFDGRQPPHQRAASRHPMEPNGQRDGHDGRQAFRDRRDRQGDPGLDASRPRAARATPQDRRRPTPRAPPMRGGARANRAAARAASPPHGLRAVSAAIRPTSVVPAVAGDDRTRRSGGDTVPW